MWAATDALLPASSWPDSLVAHLVSEVRSFAELVATLPGVHPIDVLGALQRRPDDERCRFLIADAGQAQGEKKFEQEAALPLPHPCDAEYRFTEACAKQLAERLMSVTAAGDDMLLIGTPTVALALRSAEDRVTRFVGPDDCITDALVGACPRMVRGVDGGRSRAAAALVDPPWYAPAFTEMLHAAAYGCKPGATIFVVLPSEGVRPSAAQDRTDYLRSAADAHLRYVGSLGPVRYRTPLFEVAAMEASGVTPLADWRTGELVYFERLAGELERPAPPPTPCEFVCAGIRLRLLLGAEGSPRQFAPLHPGEVFPSISFRAPRRSEAVLWTSGNRAFAGDPQLLATALHQLATDPALLPMNHVHASTEPLTPSNVDPATRLIHDLAEVVRREIADATRLVGEKAWLRTGTAWRC